MEINVLEILKSRKDIIGEDLYSPIYGWGKLTKLTDRIHVKFPKENNHKLFDRFGKFSSSGEIMLFPNKDCDVDSWISFKFMEGDFINDNGTLCIYKKTNSGITYDVFAGIDFENNLHCAKDDWGTKKSLIDARLATEEEMKVLLDRLYQEKRYCWDSDIKVLYNVFEPGDLVINKFFENAGVGVVKETIDGNLHFTLYRSGGLIPTDTIDSDSIVLPKYSFNSFISEKAYEFRLMKEDEREIFMEELENSGVDLKHLGDKFDPLTLKPFDQVLVRPDNSNVWECDFFSSYNPECDNPFHCISLWTDQCIPFNEETKHLVGTINEPSKYYRVWEKQ